MRKIHFYFHILQCVHDIIFANFIVTQVDTSICLVYLNIAAKQFTITLLYSTEQMIYLQILRKKGFLKKTNKHKKTNKR